MIDADSIVPCDDALLERFAKIPLLKDWIEKKIEQKRAGKEHNAGNPDGLVDGTIDTNLGVFRAYLKLYLDSNPDIASTGDGNTCFVTTLPQTPSGIPLQVYCFTSTSNWTNYEAIMASVFEHIAVMLHEFRLYTYESPSGRDTIIDGFICRARIRMSFSACLIHSSMPQAAPKILAAQCPCPSFRNRRLWSLPEKGETRLLRTRRQVCPCLYLPYCAAGHSCHSCEVRILSRSIKKYSGDDWFRSIFYENVPEELFPQGEQSCN